MNNEIEEAPRTRLANNGAPYKSTTHEERYYHIEHDGTVFFRLETDGWYASVAIRDFRDNWNRRAGRNAARRKYFQQPRKRHAVLSEPSYDIAEDMVEEAWRARDRFMVDKMFGR